MGKESCCVCDNELGRFASKNKLSQFKEDFKIKYKKANIEIQNLADDDIFCGDCMMKFNTRMVEIENQVKEEKNQVKEEKNAELTARYNEINSRSEEYKQHWDKSGVIQFKNERIAILQRRFGQQVQFIVAYDDLTKEGYRLMAIDEGKEASGGSLAGGVNAYFYFQKMEFVR